MISMQKKTDNKDSKGCHMIKKKKGDQKTNKKQDKEKTKTTKVKQTDSNKQPFQNKLLRKTKEICNNGDRGE